MTIQEPDDNEILAALEGEWDEPPVVDAIDVTKLSDLELANLLADTREKLFDMGEMMSDLQNTFGTPGATPEARDAHSLRLACLVELKNRGLR